MPAKIVEVRVPDIGGAEDVAIIECAVAVGDQVALEDPLLTLESDKATMDIPAPQAGKISTIEVAVGDTVSEGDLIMRMELADAPTDSIAAEAEKKPTKTAKQKPAALVERVVEVPDIGGAEQVAVIEVLAKVGDSIAMDDPLVTLESDKATMDVPAPFAGKLLALDCAVGDKVSAGDKIALMQTAANEDQAVEGAVPVASSSEGVEPAAAAAIDSDTALDWDDDESAIIEPNFYAGVDVYAGPAVRRLARELGVDLTLIKKPTGGKRRITKNDLKAYVKQRTQSAGADSAMGVVAMPKVDFAKFGEIEKVELTRIQQLSGKFLHRNWVHIPHVTQFDDADITDMEAARQAKKGEAAKQGIRLTPLAFIMKAVQAAMQQFPKFNASLDADGKHLILKKYCHIGVAVDTPNGLVVAVIRDVDTKGIYQLAQELAEISAKAREQGLTPAEMQGGCMTISSLGGIGGTAFTPIVNAPEVAILGVSRSQQKPVYDAKSKSFTPRLMLPLCLSYDHRVIDGADGARFITYLSQYLAKVDHLEF